MWHPKSVDEPASEPVSLADAKAALPASISVPDDTITAAIQAARDFIEQYCWIRLPKRSVVATCDGFSDLARLPEAPVSAVTSIVYVDDAGAEQTLDDATYELREDGIEPTVVLAHGASWPHRRAGSRITVTMTAGYETLPPAVKSALLLSIGKFVTLASRDPALSREAVVGVSTAEYMNTEVGQKSVDGAIGALLANYRRNA
jgi:uncharacterized phiE125 gp8 family phage protein